MSKTFSDVKINYANVGTHILKGEATRQMLLSMSSQAASAFGKKANKTRVETHPSRISVSVNCGKVGR